MSMLLTCFDCTLAIMTQPDAEMHKQLIHIMHQTAKGFHWYLVPAGSPNHFNH
jgi:hypothetical protein